jgi:competence protein ComEA
MDQPSEPPRNARRGDAGEADELRSILDPPSRSAASGLRGVVADPRRRRLLLGIAGAAVVVWLGWWLLAPVAPPVELSLPRADAAEVESPLGDATGGAPPPSGGAPSTAATPTTTATQLVVHVAGAVGTPGVVTARAGDRVADAVAAAGGLRPDADPNRVNLAAPLEDGSRVYVPVLGEEGEPPVVAPEPPPGTDTGSGSVDDGGGPVDLNRATAEELQRLPGVGPATAAAILAHRESNGPFRSVDQLDDVRGIGPAKLEQLRPLVVVGR